MVALAACKPSQRIVEVPVEVPVETVRTEYIHDTKIDSVFVRDSVDRWRSGDTVYIYKEHTYFKYLNQTDTVLKVDTIPQVIKVPVQVPVEVVKEVKVNYITWYQKVLMWAGGVVLLLLIAYIIYKIKKK